MRLLYNITADIKYAHKHELIASAECTEKEKLHHKKRQCVVKETVGYKLTRNSIFTGLTTIQQVQHRLKEGIIARHIFSLEPQVVVGASQVV